MSQTKTMKTAIETILKNLGCLEAFASDPYFSIRLRNEPFAPLTIERNASLVRVAHYIQIGEDIASDPEIEFLMSDQQWTPISIQDSNGMYLLSGEFCDSAWLFDADTLTKLSAFSTLWA